MTSGGCFLWDEHGSQPWNCRYGKNFWHLPLPEGADLADLELPNGIRYRCVEPLQKYEISYCDPDGDAVEIDLTYDAICPPNYLGESHLDQPGRYTGRIKLDGEEIAVDSYGFRDRSWGVRDQFGTDLTHSGAPRGGYSYATQDEGEAFHAITMEYGGKCVVIHGYLCGRGCTRSWRPASARCSNGRRGSAARPGSGSKRRTRKVVSS